MARTRVDGLANFWHPLRWCRLFFRELLGQGVGVTAVRVSGSGDRDAYYEYSQQDPEWDGDWDEVYATGEMEI